MNVKITKIEKQSDRTYLLSYTGNSKSLAQKSIIKVGEMEDATTANQLFQVIAVNKSSKTILGRLFTPGIYAWTTESYEKNSIYKIGMVNFQTFDERLKQTDTTGVLDSITMIEGFELDTMDPKITEEIEKTIHRKLENLGMRVRKNREAFKGDWKTVMRPIILDVIKYYKTFKSTVALSPNPRYYQTEACFMARGYYQENDRGSIQWTCGSGKSYTCWYIIKEMLGSIKGQKNNVIVILVPSKQLVIQTGSDVQGVMLADGVKLNGEGVIKVFSEKGGYEAPEIATVLNHANEETATVIIACYQSYQKVVDAFKMSTVKNADVAIFDEAHKTVGQDTKMFKKAIRTGNATKKLFMTASPVYYNANDYNYSGMENEQTYGKCFHRYGYIDAMMDGYVTPIQILAMGCDPIHVETMQNLLNSKRPMLAKYSEGNEIETEANFVYHAQLHFTIQNIMNGVYTHPIIYTNSIKRAEMFAQDLIILGKQYDINLNALNVKVLTGSDSAESRDRYLKETFANQDISVVVNARCLQEGISVPCVDAVAIIDPRSSAPDIIQILGRPVRLYTGKSKAYVQLPFILTRDYDNKVVIDKSLFGPTRDWMTAIAASDEDFAQMILSDSDAMTIEITEESRNGISMREVLAPSAHPNRTIVRKDDVEKTEIAPEDVTLEMLNELRHELYLDVLKNKNRAKATSKASKNHDAKVAAHDYFVTKQRELLEMVDSFKSSSISKYAKAYNETINDWTEELLLKNIENEVIISAINTYSVVIDDCFTLQNELKILCEKQLLKKLEFNF